MNAAGVSGRRTREIGIRRPARHRDILIQFLAESVQYRRGQPGGVILGRDGVWCRCVHAAQTQGEVQAVFTWSSAGVASLP
jgi:hypothetical protein